MERSMVQELNGLTNSQFISNRSTFISTAFNEGDFELRKSRIQNLPGYRKEDMSARVNFVVVFQSIEIQRLSNEVEALRVALKDAQRQNFNVKNYEVQIRQLTQKCFAYERERQQYRDEIDKLNMICEKLYEQLQSMKSRFADIDPTIKQKFRLQRQRTQKLQEQLQKWRARYNALETSKNRQMQDMRLMMENQRKSMIDRQIKQLSLRFNSQRQNLQKQIRKLRQMLDSKDMQIQKVNGKISQLQILNQQLRRYEHTIDQYQNKFAMISQEAVRLNDLLRHKQEQYDRLTGEVGNYKRRINQLQRKVRQLQQGGGQKAKALQQQLRDWRAKNSKLQQQNRQYKQQLSKIPQFKQVIQQINNESDKLKDAVRQKMGQIDDWKNRYQKIDVQFKNNKAQQQQKLPALQNKLNQLGNENDRLNNALKNRASQIQNWKNKFSDAQKQILRLGNLQHDKKNLEGQLNNYIRQNNQYQSYIKQLQPQAKKLGDIQRQLSNSKSQNQQCRKQIDRLNNAARNFSEKADNLDKKCASLQRDLKSFTQIQQQLRIYKQKQINLTKQIDRINGVISQKIRQIQNLKQVFQRFEKGLSQYQGIQKKLLQSVNQAQKLMHDLDQSRKQAGFLQDKLVSIQSQNRKVKNDVFVLSQQKQQIIRAVNTKTQQLEQAKAQIGQLQGNMAQLRQKQARLRQVQQKLRVLQNNLSQTDRRFKSQQNRSKQLNQLYEQTSTQLNKVKREGMMSPQFKQQFFQLRSQSEQRQRQIKSLQQRINTIQGLLRKLRQASIKQDQITKKNNDKIGLITKQFDVSSQAMKKMFDMQSQMMKLSQQNMQLQGKVRIMGVQNANLKQTYANQTGTFQSDRDTTSATTGMTKRSSSTGGQFDNFSSRNVVNSTFSTVTTTTNNNMYTNPLTPSPNFQINAQNQSITNIKNQTSGVGFNFPGSQGTISSTSNVSKTQSFVSYDGLKKPQLNQQQTDAPRFQFRTNQRPDM